MSPRDEVAALRADLTAAHELAARLRLEAESHAQEARTQRSTVHEIYQLVTGAKGEPGDWNGAEPVREAFARLRVVVEAAERLLAEVECVIASHAPVFHGDEETCPNAICVAARAARAALGSLERAEGAPSKTPTIAGAPHREESRGREA